jgi:uncharacterized membrane protein
MIRTVWPYLAIMLLAAGIFPALERRYGWRFFSLLPPIAHRPARFAARLAHLLHFSLFRFGVLLCGIASLRTSAAWPATARLAASYSRNLVPPGILSTRPGYILGTGFGLLVATVLSTLSSV